MWQEFGEIWTKVQLVSSVGEYHIKGRREETEETRNLWGCAVRQQRLCIFDQVLVACISALFQVPNPVLYPYLHTTIREAACSTDIEGAACSLDILDFLRR